MVLEFHTQLASSLLLILKEGQNPKRAGDQIAPYFCALLLAIEVFVPLLAPFLEELMSKGEVNMTEFLMHSKQFWLVPALVTPLTIEIAFYFLSTNNIGENQATKEILGLKNIKGNDVTYWVWNLVSAMYGQASLFMMLPYLCDIRKENVKAEKQKQIDD